MTFAMIFGLVVFVVAFILIASEKVNEAVVALMGAFLFVFAGIVSQKDAFHHEIDWNVIFLLIGMMIIVGITKQTGLFQYIAIKMAKLAKGKPFRIMLYLSIITAVFSAFLDNVTTILILTPITILITLELDLSPVPFIISEIIASNLGGTATLIGDPPNVMIGSAAHLSFLEFITNLAPVIIFMMVVFGFFSYIVWGRKMKISNERRARIMEFKESRFIENKVLLIKSLIVLGLVVLGFMLHGLIHFEPASIALSGAALLLFLSGEKEVEHFFHEVDWTTIFFFIGLFILVGGLVELGIIKLLAKEMIALTKGDIKSTSVLVIWGSGVISGVVNNIPYVATMIPLIKEIGVTSHLTAVQMKPLWWSLALGACLGGNGTLIGASANVVASGISGKNGYKIGFWDFTKYGIIATIINLVISTLYILLFYF